MTSQSIQDAITLRDKLIDGGMVVRYHQDPGPILQTTGQHAWAVTQLLAFIIPPSFNWFGSDGAGEVNGEALLREALVHDYDEAIIGDLSYHAKREHPALSREYKIAAYKARQELCIHDECLTKLEHKLLKWADLMEAGLWGRKLYLTYGFPRGLDIYRAALEGGSTRPGLPAELVKRLPRLREFIRCLETVEELKEKKNG